MKSEYPGVAQLVARLNGVQEAASSNLVTRTESFRNLTLCQVSEIFYSFLFCSVSIYYQCTVVDVEFLVSLIIIIVGIRFSEIRNIPQLAVSSYNPSHPLIYQA